MGHGRVGVSGGAGGLRRRAHRAARGKSKLPPDSSEYLEYAATLAQAGMADLAVPRDRLLADAIGRHEAAAAHGRLQKIRAVGRK